jgi:glycerophosphoryl diester phosphodiesterase
MSLSARSFTFILLGIISLGFGFGGMGWADKRIEEMKVPYSTGKVPVAVIAHRGFSGAAPENTLAAFQKGIEIGSDMIELDIHLCKDGKVVVIHDETLERTTNAQGRVVDYTLKELKKFDAGSWFGPQFSGERIPTLGEVLELAKGRVPVNIEIKNPTHGQYPITQLADQALRKVKEAGMIHRVVFSSFNPLSLEWIKKKEPQVGVALLYHEPWSILSDVTGGEKYEVLNLRRTYLTKDKIAKIHKERMKVNVYTVNSQEEMEQFIRWAVDGIITNHPDQLMGILEKRLASTSPAHRIQTKAS